MKNLSKLFVVFVVMFSFLVLPCKSYAHPFIWGMSHHLVRTSVQTTWDCFLPAEVYLTFFALNWPNMVAWEKAKANHTEVQFQSTERFPQQFFDTLPGGNHQAHLKAMLYSVQTNNGGSLPGGNSGPIQ